MARRARVATPSNLGEFREDWERGLMALLPDNYSLVVRFDIYIVEGEDQMGWTLDEYVIPRLASGNYFAEEIKLNTQQRSDA